MDISSRLSQRTNQMGVNAIREILKVVSKGDVISLAGGIPAPESFPLDVIRQLTNDVLDEYGAAALQYDATEGFYPLRTALIEHLRARGVPCELDELAVFSGSQSILDTVAKMLISPGDTIAVEVPSYVGALSAFNAYEPNYVAIETDENGLIPDSLEAILKNHTVKFVYLVPTFQNPTGRTLTQERRERVAELLKEYDVLLLEDDPYGALRYSGESPTSIRQLAPDHVIYSSSFSKIMAPGLRIGYCVAPTELMEWLIVAKQGADLHTQTFGQAIAALYLTSGHLDSHLPNILELYRPRRDAMLTALETHMPEGFTWSHPDGGMFLWVEGPADLDGEALYWRCVERGVAFVPGKFFYFEDGAGENTLRLNFTMVPPATIDQAIRLLAETASEMLREKTV